MTQKNIRYRAFVLLAALFFLFSFITCIQSLWTLRSYARVTHFTGVVRGATQRLAKQELMDTQNDLLILRLDEILLELQTGGGPDRLIFMDDDEYQQRLRSMANLWTALKNEIDTYRAKGGRDSLTSLSEVYYSACDEAITAAESATDRVHNVLRASLLVLLSVLVACVAVCARFFQNHSRSFRRAAGDLATLNEALPGGVLHVRGDTCHTILSISDGLLHLLGYTRDEVRKRFHDHFFSLVCGEDLGRVQRELAAKLASSDTAFELEYRLVRKDDSTVWVLDKGRVEKKDGAVPVFYSVLIDMTKNRETLHELLLNEKRYAIIMDQTQDVIFEWDVKNDTMYHSPNFFRKFGYQPPVRFFFEFLHDSDFLPEEDKKTLFDARDRLMAGAHYQELDYRIKAREGYLWCRVKITMLFDEKDAPVKMVGIISDIDAQKRNTLLLENRAQCDSLTGLYNKMTAQALVENCLSSAKDQMYALFMVDVDNFKEINDTLGHLFGDAVLTEVAKHLKQSFRSRDIIGRIGGDEFMVFLKDIPSEQLALQKAAAISQTFRHLFSGVQENHKITASIGISIFPRDGKSFPELFRRADLALYCAKDRGKDQYCLYSEEVERAAALHQYVPRTDRTDRIESGKMKQSFTRYVFDILYEAKDLDSAINGILDLTARYYNVSHVYIYQDEGGAVWHKAFEWCSHSDYAFAPETDAFCEDREAGKPLYDADGVLYCTDLDRLPPTLGGFLRRAGVHSILQTPMMENGVCMGCIGFCEHVDSRFWTQEEVDASIFISKTVSLFLLNKRQQDRQLEAGRAAQHVLDQMKMNSYVVNQDRILLYINKTAQKREREVKTGQPCYQELRGESAPCGDCPIDRLHGEECVTTEIFNGSHNKWMEISAAGIHWLDHTGAYLITCRDLTRRKAPPAQTETEGRS